MKVILWLLLTPIAIILLGISGIELNKAYWDWQVRRMCEAEGGVEVYETVALTEEEFLRLGGVWGKPLAVPSSDSARSEGMPYVASRRKVTINRSDPEVWRWESAIYRKNDKRLLGKYVTFARRGGDFPMGIAHESSFGCQYIAGFDRSITAEIFSIEGEI